MGTWFEIPVTPPLPGDLDDRGLHTRITNAKGGPHITIVHLGDFDLETDRVDEIREVATSVVDDMRREHGHDGPYAIDVTGSAQFLVGARDWMVPVLLVKSEAISLLYDTLCDTLLARLGFEADNTYHFTPHITLEKGPALVLQRRFQVTGATLDLVTSKGGKELGRWRTAL